MNEIRYFHQTRYTYVWAQYEVTVKKSRRLATWWRYNMKKNTKRALTTWPLVRFTWKLEYSVLVQGAMYVYEDIGVSRKTWPPSANEIWAPIETERISATPTPGGKTIQPSPLTLHCERLPPCHFLLLTKDRKMPKSCCVTSCTANKLKKPRNTFLLALDPKKRVFRT